MREFPKVPKWTLGIASVFQIVLALLLCFGILFSLGMVETQGILGVVGTTSLGSSLFIMLSQPNSNAARPKRMVGSYLVGILVGAVFYYISIELIMVQQWLGYQYVYMFTGGFALAVTMLIMVFADLGHPPAVGLALGVVLDPWNWLTLLIILICIIMLVAVRYFLKPWLRTLRFRS